MGRAARILGRVSPHNPDDAAHAARQVPVSAEPTIGALTTLNFGPENKLAAGRFARRAVTLSTYSRANGVWAPSSNWFGSARNP